MFLQLLKWNHTTIQLSILCTSTGQKGRNDDLNTPHLHISHSAFAVQ